MSAVVTLTTDFGLTDGYVAAMKGVILSVNPEATLVDITHTIRPQGIAEAAFIISTACPYFPPNTVHLVVVDPGVGTERKAVILKTKSTLYVAPDNGVLSYIIASSPEFEAIEITNEKFWRTPVSSTFHGRDIFAPVAGALSLGVSPEKFGWPLDSASLVTLPLSRPSRAADGSLVGHIIHIDGFGNLVTDIRSQDLPAKAITIKIGTHLIKKLSRTYAEAKGLLALIGSSDYLEVSLNGGSAAEFLNAKSGDELRVTSNKRAKK